MPRLQPPFANAPLALPAISVILIALLAAGYGAHRISYGFTTLMLLALPLTLWLARGGVPREQHKQRRAMMLAAALSLASAAVLAAIHFLHR